MIRYHARWVLPVTAPPVQQGTVAVDGETIAYVGPRRGAPPGDDVELGDAVLMPGLVDAHTRLEDVVFRDRLAAIPVAEREPVRARSAAALAGDAWRTDAARLALAEGVRAGVTTYADTSPGGASLPALREYAVRGRVYHEVLGPTAEERAPALARLAAALSRLRPDASPLVGVGVAPGAVHAVHEDLLIDACALALGARLPIAIPVAQSAEEIAFLREAAGPFAERLRACGAPVVRRAYSPVHLLVELGVDIAHPVLLHCVQLDASDVAFVAERACPVVHCPTSDAALGHGVAPVTELLAAGAIVGLGSAGGAGGRIDLLGEARAALLLQRARLGRADALSAGDALAMATIGGARALGLDAVAGSLEVGKNADLAAFTLSEADVAVGGGDPVAATLARARRPAVFVAVAGRVLLHHGRLRVADPGLAARVGAAARALVEAPGGDAR